MGLSSKRPTAGRAADRLIDSGATIAPSLGGSSNGKTLGSGPSKWGSNPCPPALSPVELWGCLFDPVAMKLCEAAARLKEVGVGSGFDYAAVFEDDDHIGLTNG